jgi:small subunit ribosomal protein S5
MSTETDSPVTPDTTAPVAVTAAPASDAPVTAAPAADTPAPAPTAALADVAQAAEPARSTPDTAQPPKSTSDAPAPEAAADTAAEPTPDARPIRRGAGGRRGEGAREGGRREGGERRGPRRDRPAFSDPNAPEMVEKIVYINRCAKVVKGGRRFSFAALAVVGDKKGSVGIGYGKANEVPDAIKKGTENAKKRMVTVKLKGDTIPHEVYGEYDGGRVLLRPAVTGTGLIAGGAVRAVLEAAGIKHILTKSMGSKNHIAVVHATLNGLKKLRLADQIKTARATIVAPAE